MHQRRVEVRTGDGLMDVHIYHPAGPGSWPAVLLYMDAMGIRPDLLSMAERLATHGHVVAVPNLFYRAGVIQPVDAQAFVSPGSERDRVMALIQSINHEKVAADTRALVEFLDRQPETGSKIGTVGYCMGGGYALAAAAHHPRRVVAAASFHGGRLATDRPDSPHLLAPRIKGRVYVGVAGIDPMFSDEEREQLRAALEAAGVDFLLEVYPGVRHGFTVAGHPVYDEAGSERHWQRLLSLFGGSLASE
jgi:carboxymethylenebutenolidase